MAATVQVQRFTGAGPTGTDITGINTRMKQNDSHATGGTDNPVPAVTTSYSFWISTRLVITVAPTTGINNVKWYSGGTAFGTGITVNGEKASTGATAGYRQASSAIVLNQTNHTGLDAAPADVTTFTSGSPKTLTGSIGATTGSGTIEYFVYQAAVTSSAAAGPSGARTFTWQYDET